MRPEISKRLLRVAAFSERLADTKLSFDSFVRRVNETHGSMAQTIKSAEDVKSLLDRSGYPELAGRMSAVLADIRDVSHILDMFRKMYSQGKLRYGPRIPVSVWEKRTIREKSPFETQERPRSHRPTRQIDTA